MFKKLLNYDLRAVFKTWWIAAAVSFCASLIGGLCISVIRVEYTKFKYLQTLAVLSLVLMCVCLVAFLIVSAILIYVRFYKHFFSDEGYLTFTLPVKRVALLNSKILTAVIFEAVTTVVLIIDVTVMLSIGFSEYVFDAHNWEAVFETLSSILGELTGIEITYLFVYLLEALLGVIVLTVSTPLILFCCLTIAAQIAKKHRIIVTIAVYYGISAVFSFVAQILMSLGYYKIFNWIVELSQNTQMGMVALIFLLILSVSVALTCAFYIFEYYLLDRKLNLE